MAISTKSRFPENIQLVAPAGTNAALDWLASIRQAQALLNEAKAIGMAWARPGSRYLVPLGIPDQQVITVFDKTLGWRRGSLRSHLTLRLTARARLHDLSCH